MTIIQFKQIFILFGQCVFGFCQDMNESIFIQIIQCYHNRQTTDEFRNQTIFQQILRHQALQQFIVCFIQLAVNICAKTDDFVTHTVLDDLFDAAKGAAADKQNVCSVNLDKFLMRVLSAALRKIGRASCRERVLRLV